MPARPRRLAALSSSFAVISLLLTSGAPAAADSDQLDERSTATFRILPDEKVVRSQVDVTLIARKKPTYRVGRCKGNRSRRCRIKTSYYWKHWSSVWIPSGATDLRFDGRGVASRTIQETSGWTSYEVTFRRIDFKEKQTFSVAFDLPSGDPQTDAPTRVGEAYAHFCWFGQPTDTGSVRAVLPPGWEARSYGHQPSTTSSATATTLKAPGKKEPVAFFTCTEAFDPQALVRDYVLSPGGSLVTVEGWPEDALWTALLVEEIETTLPVLEGLIGSPMPLRELVVRESSTQALRWAAGDPYPSDGVIRMTEDISDIEDFGLVTGRLARTWFDASSIAEPWLREGLSLWTTYQTLESSCPTPDRVPGEELPGLAEWMTPETAGDAYDQTIATDQAAAACGIVAEVAAAIGTARMTDVISTLLAAPEPADWKAWLAAVETRGLIPAGADDQGLAERQLRDHGIASAAELSGRTSAMEVYVEALTDLEGTRLPAFVDRLMADWRFPDALMGIADARRTFRAIAEHPGMAADDRAMFLAAFEAAESPEALLSLAASVETYRPAPGADGDEGLPAEDIAVG